MSIVIDDYYSEFSRLGQRTYSCIWSNLYNCGVFAFVHYISYFFLFLSSWYACFSLPLSQQVVSEPKVHGSCHDREFCLTIQGGVARWEGKLYSMATERKGYPNSTGLGASIEGKG